MMYAVNDSCRMIILAGKEFAPGRSVEVTPGMMRIPQYRYYVAQGVIKNFPEQMYAQRYIKLKSDKQLREDVKAFSGSKKEPAVILSWVAALKSKVCLGDVKRTLDLAAAQSFISNPETVATEAPAQEEKPVETVVAEPVAEPAAEPAAEQVAEPVKEETPAEEPVEAPVEETVETPAEEPVEAPAEEPVQDAVESETAEPEMTGTPAEESVSEPAAEDDEQQQDETPKKKKRKRN